MSSFNLRSGGQNSSQGGRFGENNRKSNNNEAKQNTLAERRSYIESRRAPGEEGSDEDNWMVTYSDMVTLLLTFFILLFSPFALALIILIVWRRTVKQRSDIVKMKTKKVNKKRTKVYCDYLCAVHFYYIYDVNRYQK